VTDRQTDGDRVTAKTALMHMHRAVKMTSVNENVAFILTLFIAQSLVSVPAASTASDRASHLLVTQWRRRCQLHPDSVDGLLFVHRLKH